MKPVSAAFSRALWCLRLLATVLAVGGQLGISGASLTLARDESSAISHTERSGIDLHHGHNEATCAACTALSFQATVNPAAPSVSSKPIARSILARRLAQCVTAPYLLTNSCRAPPREA